MRPHRSTTSILPTRPGEQYPESEDRPWVVRHVARVALGNGLDAAYDGLHLLHGRAGERDRVGDQRAQHLLGHAEARIGGEPCEDVVVRLTLPHVEGRADRG